MDRRKKNQYDLWIEFYEVDAFATRNIVFCCFAARDYIILLLVLYYVGVTKNFPLYRFDYQYNTIYIHCQFLLNTYKHEPKNHILIINKEMIEFHVRL